MTEKLDPDDQGFTAVYSEKPIEYARRMAQESEYGDELAIEFYCMAFRRNVAVWTPGQDLPVVVTHLHHIWAPYLGTISAHHIWAPYLGTISGHHILAPYLGTISGHHI